MSALLERVAILLGLVAVTAPTLAVGEETFRLADGVELAYVDRGTREPELVFVHCGMCRKEIWTETLDAFASTHRVVAVDLPGHGRSGVNLERLSISTLGADVAALVEHLGLHRLVFVGNSLGGPVSLEAARHLGPERVLGVVGVDTLHDLGRAIPEDVVRRRVEAFRRDFRGSCSEMMVGLLGKDAPPPVRARLERETCDNDPEAAIALLESLPEFDQASCAAEAGVPVRAINSKVHPTAVDANREIAVSFEVTLMDGVGHFPQIESPKAFQSHLRRVVDELSTQPPAPADAPSPGR